MAVSDPRVLTGLSRPGWALVNLVYDVSDWNGRRRSWRRRMTLDRAVESVPGCDLDTARQMIAYGLITASISPYRSGRVSPAEVTTDTRRHLWLHIEVGGELLVEGETTRTLRALTCYTQWRGIPARRIVDDPDITGDGFDALLDAGLVGAWHKGTDEPVTSGRRSAWQQIVAAPKDFKVTITKPGWAIVGHLR